MRCLGSLVQKLGLNLNLKRQERQRHLNIGLIPAQNLTE